MRRPRGSRLLWLGALVATVAVAVVLGSLAGRGHLTDEPDPGGQTSERLEERDQPIDATEFLETYVEDDGRVVRIDQGGDTVSEGQAYGMLIAVTAGDQDRFDRIWAWTRANLARPDGLFSWRWEAGEVVDPSSASDAEIDMARALLVAAERFADPGYRDQAVTLGDAVLEHMTIETDAGRVLVAGEWATALPAWFNPSYVSPVTTRMLADASGDDRWQDLERGSRAAVVASMPPGQLPPDWTGLEQDGTVFPRVAPDGSEPAYGYDAARTLVRHAESCTEEDRQIAARAARVIAENGANDQDGVRAVHDLGGGPRSEATSPLSTVAQAAGLAADGREGEAVAELAEAAAQQQQAPTYYGDAWVVLGQAMLVDGSLGGCSPLGDRP